MPKFDSPKLDRRAFVIGTAAAGAGLTVGFSLDPADAADATPEVNAWAVINPDDSVVIRIAKSEMGQGTLTGLAQLTAEELGCDWSKVSTEFPTPGQNVARKRVWGDYFTAGSQGVRSSQELVRKGGAAARMMLIQAAANDWKVPAEECSAANSVISHTKTDRKTTFGKVAAAAAKIDPPKDIPLKDPKTWTIAGKPLKRLDTPPKIVGKPLYGIDVREPNMLYAAISQCPVFGGKLQSVDEAKVHDMPGVKKVVKVGDNSVAVVADSWWRAKKALEAMPISWDEGENVKVSSASIAQWLKEGLDTDEGFVGNKVGDAKAALSGAKIVEATYSYPYQSHAPMEPMNATALYTADKCTVWCPTQNGEAALAAVAEASGLQVAQCDVIKTYLGGGFGRRGQTDYVRQAVAIAKELPGTPIKLLWTREEDTTHDVYHPVTQCKMRAAFDDKKNLVALHMRISGQSIVAYQLPSRLVNGMDPFVFSHGLAPKGPEGEFGYNIPNLLIDHAMRNPPIPPGFWRGVNLNHNAIYVETFVDQLAHEVGEDPLAFRLKYLKPKHAAVLRAVAEKAGYDKPLPKGVYRGIAQIMGFGSYVAAVAEVSVTNGHLDIHRIVGGTNCGHAANPEQVMRQIEGSFVYGLSAMLYGECTVRAGRIEQKNFDTYQVMRMEEMPKVEFVVMPDGEFWGGVGEPTIAVAAPAVLNAIFAATGKRIYNFPLKNNDLSAA
ncbi:MAG TPA: molybdopterin cofactor-binding domain-containing protein [Xanthobacteraceae bacterium]|nr:molybdopterin cofactor-binding domain-containing protein [Xanthobacteraceae bacterium]